MIRLLTRQSEDFDILTENIDPARSKFADDIKDYVAKVRAFSQQLGIPALIWTWPEDQPPEFFELHKPVECLLAVEEGRAICYVDEWAWRDFLLSDQLAFSGFSRIPKRFLITSILVAAPIRSPEIKEVRRYRTNKLGHAELVSTTKWSGPCGE